MSPQLCRDSDPNSRSESDLEVPCIMPRSCSLAITLFSLTRSSSKMEIHMFSLGLFFEAVTPQGMEVTCSAPAGRKNATHALGSVLIVCPKCPKLEQNQQNEVGHTVTEQSLFCRTPKDTWQLLSELLKQCFPPRRPGVQCLWWTRWPTASALPHSSWLSAY